MANTVKGKKIQVHRRRLLQAALSAPLAFVWARSGAGQPRPASDPSSAGAGRRIRRRYVDGRFGQVHVYVAAALDDTSAKTPLMCFHPTAVSGDFFRDFMLEMSGDRLVMAMDTPGYGRSDPPPEPQPMIELAGTAADALDALGFGANGQGAVDLIGYHTGCFIASELAVIRPDLVRRLVLPGIPFNVGDTRKEMYEQYARPSELTEDGTKAMEIWEFWVTGRHPDVSLQRGASHFADHLQSGPYSWWAYHSVFSYPAEERLPLVRQPVLVPNTHGNLQENSRAAAELIADVKVVEMPDLTHGVFDVGVDRLAAVSREFLD